MAQRTANTQRQNTQNNSGNDIAEMYISGILDSVYVGKKYCYADVKVQNADNKYYSIYKVQTPLDYDFPEDGERFECNCTAKCYQGQISLSIK